MTKKWMRWMAFKESGPDLLDILGIEQQSYSHAWTQAQFDVVLGSKCVAGIVSEQSESTSPSLLFQPGLVTGYAIFKHYPDHLYLLALAVLRDARRSGIGSGLIGRLKLELVEGGREAIITKVADTNLAAQLFLKSCGFEATQIMPISRCDKDCLSNSECSYKFEYQINR